MNTHPADFRVEIIKGQPQGVRGIQFIDTGITEVEFNLIVDPPGEVVDITGYVPRDGMGSINRACERDLLSFKTGDITLTLRNHDGYFTDLFAFFDATTIWGLRIYRRGDVQFYGCLIGPGSIIFDTKEKTVEVTAYGLSKLLDRTNAELVRRPIAEYSLGSVLTAGDTNVTLSGTPTFLLTGDTVHVTDQDTAEDLLIKQITSASGFSLEAAASGTYASGNPVRLASKFERYRSLSYLVAKLFKAAFIAVSDYRVDRSDFKTAGPTPVNQSGLPAFTASNPTYTCPAYLGARFDTHLVDGTYSQATPDAAWTQADATIRAWVDWSKYYLETDTGPTFYDRCPFTGESAANPQAPHQLGWDTRAATHIMYYVDDGPKNLRQRTSADGTTWAADALVSAIPGYPSAGAGSTDAGCDFDPVRNQVLVWTNQGAGVLQLYDVGGGTWSSCLVGDEGASVYGGFTYCRDLDCFLGLLSSAKTGPDFQIAAFRNGQRLWLRTFPSCKITTTAAIWGNWPTHSMRYIDGKLYTVMVADGEAQLVVSDDLFVTYRARSLNSIGSGARIYGGRGGGFYHISAYKSALQRGIYVAAPFYAGVISYADFEGMSAAEALKSLSTLTNSLFWVDDDLQGHFVARDLYDPGLVLDITDRVMERSDTLVWDETKQYVTVSGNDVEATSGDAGFSSDGIDLSSDLIPNEAYAQSLADDYFDFYSAKRHMLEITVRDPDGHIYRPLDRVIIEGSRYFVYESDHNLTDDTVNMTLLEDL